MADTWLGRFRIDGVNHEGRKWYLAQGGVALAREVNALWPDRHGADGTVAGESHDQNNPRSDHRPYPYDADPAVVRALDVGENVENDGFRFAEMLRATQDPRIKYVLHEDMIFSSYSRMNRGPWTWASLSIGHWSHVHVSFTELADTDDSPWNLKGDTPVFTNHEVAELKKLVAGLDEVDSNGGFSKYAVLAIRREREAGGYAPASHGPHGGSGDGIQDGDTVQISRV